MGYDDSINVDLKSDISEGEKARRKLAEIQKETDELRASFDAGNVSLERFNQRMGQLDKAGNSANRAFKEATDGVNNLGGMSGAASNKLMVMGQTFDDLQYVGEQGLRPILNNVMQISPAVGIALIAGNLLYTQWDNIASLFGGGHVKTQAEELEELAKKTSLAADEAERLGRAQRQEKGVKELRDLRPKAEKEQDDRVKAAIAEAGGENVARGFLAARRDLVDAQGTVPEALRKEKAARDELESVKMTAGDNPDPNAIPNAERALEDAKRELAAARLKTAELITAGAFNARDFPGSAAALGAAARANPGAFGPNGARLGEDLETIGKGLDPEEERKRIAKEAKQAEKDKVKAANDAADAAIKEGDRRSKAVDDRLEKEARAAKEAPAKEAAARKAAVDKAEKLTGGTALGTRTDDALLRAGLRSGGAPGQATKEIAAALKAEFMARGMGEGEAGTAAQDIARKHADKLNDEIMTKAAGGREKPEKLETPKHIADADFARSVESAGAKDSAKLISLTEQMKEQLTEMVRQGRQGARVQ